MPAAPAPVPPPGSRLAVVGSGVAGLVAAHILSRRYEVTVFEAGAYVGGHTNTVDVEIDGVGWSIDTGFIVHNRKNYRYFVRLLDMLDVGTQPTTMSLSVREERSGIEWCGSGPASLFATARNARSGRFWRMLRDVWRFNRTAPRLLGAAEGDLTLGDWLDREKYSAAFVDLYVVPIGAAIWSTDLQRILQFPARTFVRFLHNHGMLQVVDRPVWRTIPGGSRRYVDRIVRPFRERLHVSTPVRGIRRAGPGVELSIGDQGWQGFDGVVVATHSDQALSLLQDPTEAEQEVLGAIPYQPNEAVLHTDRTLMPRSKRAWAAWNVHLPAGDGRSPSVAITYDMNILQRLRAPVEFLVTLNRTDEIAPESVLRTIRYEHPLFTSAGIAAQRRFPEVSGVDGKTWYCGAWWRYGFHEDGVRSALAVAAQFGLGLEPAVEKVAPSERERRVHEVLAP